MNVSGSDQFPSSPSWSSLAKFFVGLWLTIAAVGALLYFGNIARAMLMATVFSFVLRPTVDWLESHGVSRIGTTIVLFLSIISGLIAIPVTTLPSVIQRVTNFVNTIEALLPQFSNAIVQFLENPTITWRDFTYTLPIDVTQIRGFEQLLGDAVSIITGWIGSGSTFISNIATGTVSFFSSLALVLFIAFFLTKDGHEIAQNIIRVSPPTHRNDITHLSHRISLVWGAFLRGQLVLMLAMGILVFVIASILGLPNPIGFAVTAGMFELIPYAGPFLAAAPGLLIAFFQNESSWLGVRIGPVWFTIVTAFGYWVTQAIENYYLVPRIMGNRLKLHRAIVFAGAIAGFQIGGIFGVLVAAPMIATMREIIVYFYCKLSEQTVDELGMEYDETDEIEMTEPAAEPIIDPELPPIMPIPAAVMVDTAEETDPSPTLL